MNVPHQQTVVQENNLTIYKKWQYHAAGSKVKQSLIKIFYSGALLIGIWYWKKFSCYEILSLFNLLKEIFIFLLQNELPPLTSIKFEINILITRFPYFLNLSIVGISIRPCLKEYYMLKSFHHSKNPSKTAYNLRFYHYLPVFGPFFMGAKTPKKRKITLDCLAICCFWALFHEGENPSKTAYNLRF